MTNNNNELMVNQETGEIMQSEVIVSETEDFMIVRTPEGKYKKDMKYKSYYSRTPETEEDKIELYNVLNGDNDDVIQLKNMVGKEISVAHVFASPYQKLDEDTGSVHNMVNTTIQGTDGTYYATSSKSVYWTLNSLMDTFGRPDQEGYKPIKVEVTGTKRQNGLQIDLKLIGLE